MNVKGILKDVGGASRVTKKRSESFNNASDKPIYNNPVGDTAKQLHSGLIELELVEIREASKSSKTLKFKAKNLPYFIAGQALTLILNIDGSRVTRAYSISSAPYETLLKDPFVEITVRKPKVNGFVGDYLYDKAKLGDKYLSEVGLGEFNYDSIRDSKNIVAIAGGSGITPFVSMAKEIKHSNFDINLTIIYGSVFEDDIVLKNELDSLECEKVKVVHVLSGDNPSWSGEKGYITSEIIKKYSKGDTTYFVCGPQAMYDFVKGEFEKLNIERRRIRFELAGSAKDVTKEKEYPIELKDKIFKMTVCQGISETVIDAKSCEPIAVALERAGLKIHTACRSGFCGFCRVKVLEGTYYVSLPYDGRRFMDKEFGYVHSCSTYPTSDIKIKLNI